MTEAPSNIVAATGAPSLEQSQVAVADAAKARAEAAATADRPDWLPQNFTSVTDYVKSSTDTRAALTKAQQELAELRKTPQDPPQDQQQQPQADATAQAALTKAGVDVTPFSQEFTTTGDVSEANRAAIAKALEGQFGADARKFVDQYVDNAKLAQTSHREAAFKEVGGEEVYASLVTWAKDGLKADEIKAFNSAVNSSDPNARALAIRGLKASYEKVNGKSAALMQGDNRATTGDAFTPFSSTVEQTNAINDPRYSKDPAYRNQVVQRILATKRARG